MKEYLQQVITELKIRNYSRKTVEAYIHCLKEYFHFKKTAFDKIDENNIKLFLLAKQNKGYAPQTINLYLNAIKFFYRDIVKTNRRINIKFSKRTKKLPVVLSRDEIDRIIKATSNLKHKLIIGLAYGAGLRISEVLNLKAGDINLEELTIHLKVTKGKKDRITVLPEKLVADMRLLIVGKSINNLVFLSERGGKLAERTAQKIFETAIKKAKIQNPATFHSLRHSFATHLLENGVDIRYVQELLGHQNIRTTQQYTKVTNPKLKNIASPLR